MNRIPLILRVAAALALIQGIMHGMLHLRYSPSHGAIEQELVAHMKADSFLFGGFNRTYWDFYFGYGLMVVVTCLVQAAAIWLLARLAESRPRDTASFTALFAFAYALHAVLAWHYFFAKPVVFDLLIAAALSWAASLAWAEPRSGSGR